MKKILKLSFFLLLGTSSVSYTIDNPIHQQQVYCPICENVAQAFVPGGNKSKRHNTHCLRCGSKERHRHLWLLLQHQHPELFSATDNIIEWVTDRDGMLRPKPASLSILHFAAERSMVRKLSGRYNIDYVCADTVRPKSRPYTREIDITNTGFEDNSQDIIILDHVLQMIEQDTKALLEMKRILKPNGIIYLMLPVYNDLETTFEDSSLTTEDQRHTYFNQSNHVRKYGIDVLEKLQSSDLSVDVAQLTSIPPDIRKYYGLDGYDDDATLNAARGADIYMCTKT